MENEKRKPVKKIRVGNVNMSLWENKTKEGKTFFSITIQKSFKNSNGEWQNVNNFNKNDLSSLSFCCVKAFNDIEDLEGKEL